MARRDEGDAETQMRDALEARLRQVVHDVARRAEIAVVAAALSQTGSLSALANVLAHAAELAPPADPLAAARARGAAARERLLQRAGGALRVSEAAELMEVSRAAVNARRTRGTLLAVPLPNGEHVYPACQFTDTGVPAGLGQYLSAFQDAGPWTQLSVLLAPSARHGGRTARGVFHYGPRTNPEDRGRWDAPDDSYGVCYIAEQAHTAFAETLLRELDREEISEQDELVPRSLARLRVVHPIVLARMHGPGLRRMKATGAVVQGPYDIGWEWSRAIYDHVAGIRYRARHDDDDLSIALFERAAGAVMVLDSTPLHHPALAADLRDWLDRYDIGLAP